MYRSNSQLTFSNFPSLSIFHIALRQGDLDKRNTVIYSSIDIRIDQRKTQEINTIKLKLKLTQSSSIK